MDRCDVNIAKIINNLKFKEMKLKFLVTALLAGASIVGFAQYQDGIDFYKIGEYDNAKTILDKNLNTASNKAEAYYYLGQVALQQDDANSALSNFEQGIAADANYPYNYVGKGAIELKNGNKSDAEKLFKQARKLSKKNSALEVAIARAYYAADTTAYKKEIAKSIADARKWNANDPNPSIFEGDMYYDQKNWGDAAGLYEMAMTYDADNIEATVKYAKTYYRVNPELALSNLNRIIANKPHSALVQRQLAEDLYDHGDYQDAAERYGSYINSSDNHFPKDEARYAQLLFMAGQYAKCAEVANGLKASTKLGEGYYFVADRLLLYAYSFQGDWENAEKVGRELMNDSYGKTMGYEQLDYIQYAKALEKCNKPEEAIVAYDQAIKLDPNNMDLVRGLFSQYAKAKQYDRAMTYAQKVLDSDACTPEDYNSVAEIFVEQCTDDSISAESRIAAANQGLLYAEKAIAAEPDNILFLYNKSLLERSIEGKNTGKAIATMEQIVNAVKSKPDAERYDSTLGYAYGYLALYYYGEKNYGKALEYFKAWHEVAPDNESVNNAIKALSK